MNFASQFCYVSSADQSKQALNEVYSDINMSVISFSYLKESSDLSLGVLIFFYNKNYLRNHYYAYNAKLYLIFTVKCSIKKNIIIFYLQE